MMGKLVEMLEAEVTFLPENEGAPPCPLPDGISRTGKFRPHIVIGDPGQRKPIVKGTQITETYIGVVFTDGPNHIEIGKPQIFKMALPFWNESEFLPVVAQATFTLRAGPHIIGFGRIKRRWSEPLRK
jgi:hypothetical protein